MNPTYFFYTGMKIQKGKSSKIFIRIRGTAEKQIMKYDNC